MDGISWTDLNSDEKHVVAVLGAGFSADLCDRVAVLTLKRAGLVKGSRLTRAAERLRTAAVLHELARGKDKLSQ